jgi:hypothetical protein
VGKHMYIIMQMARATLPPFVPLRACFPKDARSMVGHAGRVLPRSSVASSRRPTSDVLQPVSTMSIVPDSPTPARTQAQDTSMLGQEPVQTKKV